MPLAFSCIAPHLQISTIKKLDYNDFANFQQCSHASHNVGLTLKTKFPLFLESLRIGNKLMCDLNYLQYHDVNNTEHLIELSTLKSLPVRITARKGSVTLNKNQFLCAISNEIKCCNIRVTELSISPALRDNAPFKLGLADIIIRHLRAKSVFLRSPENIRILSVDEDQVDLFGSVHNLQISGRVSTNNFVRLCAREVKFRDRQHFSVEEINQYLKNPKVHNLRFETYYNYFPKYDNGDFDELLYGLEASQIWNEANHFKSEFGDIQSSSWLWSGSAYFVFNGESYLLVLVNGNDFSLDRLDGCTAQEAKENGKIILRRHLQDRTY